MYILLATPVVLFLIVLLLLSADDFTIGDEISENKYAKLSNTAPRSQIETRRKADGDRGAYDRLNRLKSRPSTFSKSADFETTDSNELVQAVRKGVYRRIAPGTSTISNVPISPHKYFMQQLHRLSYEGNDHCYVSSFSSSKTGFRMVLFLDASYFPVFQNWLIYFVKVCGASPFMMHDGKQKTETNGISLKAEVVCIDRAVISLIESINLVCSSYSEEFWNSNSTRSHPRPSTFLRGSDLRDEDEEQAFRSNVWMKRLRVIHDMLVKESWDVLLCDVDALWIRDPFPNFHAFFSTERSLSRSVAIIASQGKWPSEVSTKWGSAICMGFALFRSHPFSVQLIENVISAWSTFNSPSIRADHESALLLSRDSSSKGFATWDDQYAINIALYKKSIKWTDMSQSKSKADKADQSTSIFSRIFGISSEKIASVQPAIRNSDSFYLGSSAEDMQNSIAILPRNLFVRECLLFSHHGNITEKVQNRINIERQLEQEEIKILHCHGGMRTSGTASRKIRFLKELGLWQVSE